MAAKNVECKAAQRGLEAESTQYDNYRNGGLHTGLMTAEPLSGSMYALGESSLCNGSKGKFILKEESRKRKHLISRTGLLLALLAFFAILSLILSGLLAWGALRRTEENHDIKKPRKEAKMCKFMPDPVIFRTLPLSVKKQLEDLEKFIKREIDRGQTTALSANLVYLDKIIWEGGFGVMSPNKSTSEPPTPRTIYPCASLTKILTSLMLFKLHSNGQIPSLDIPIKFYEPEFSIRNPYHSNITIRDIASQRSGLQREAPCYPATSSNLCPYNYSTMLRRISKLTLLRRPGTEPQYSNLGWSLLGQILAKTFGRGADYKTWMEESLLVPLGMENSRFNLTKTQLSALPMTRSSHNIMDWGWLVPSGGLYSTVSDLAQMEIKIFSNEFLSSDSSKGFFKEDFVFPDGTTMTGMPWEITFHKGRMIRGKTASVYGYNSYVAIVPEMKLAFNFMCTDCIQKLDDSLKEYIKKIVITMDDAIENASSKPYQLPKDTRPYIGTFNSDSNLPIPLQMEVRLNSHDKLAISINGKEDLFFLNYTQSQIFKMHLNPRHSCDELFTFGVEDDLVLFDRPSLLTGLSEGFTMYNAHPSGRTYFGRNH